MNAIYEEEAALREKKEELRKAYKGVDPDSRTAQEMRPILSTSEKILDAYVNAAVSAIEQYNTLSPTNEATAFDADGGKEAMAAQKNNTPDGVKFSYRGVNKDGIEVYETSPEVLKMSWKDRKEKYLDLLKNEYSGRKARFVRFGKVYYAEFDPANLSKPIYGERGSSQAGHDALINTGADGEIFNLVENSKYSYSKLDTKNHKDTDYFDYHVKRVQIDGTVFDMVIDVKKKFGVNDGYTYTIKLNESKTTKASPIRESGYSLNGPDNASVVDNIVSYSVPEVNTKSMKSSRNSDQETIPEEFSTADVLKSSRVTDKKKLDFLNNQEYVTTYRSMQLIDGKLYPPMAAIVNGNTEDYSELGTWEEAVEHPELIKIVNGKPKFTLNKGKGQGSIDAAYNPYMHSSNLVINDQFSGAYTRPNLVVVECHVPVSELSSGYRAQYAKDTTGWHSWHTGTVAGALRKAKGIERQVVLSRWIKPVRILSNQEVAAQYKELLSGTDISVPDNVVSPGLLTALREAGVNITESGRIKNSAAQKNNTHGGVLNSRRNAQLLSDEEVNEIQSIGRKSLNQFTSADIQATEKFARIYWNEMGVKSPFFRAWFGDWRANDNTHITVATKTGNSRGTVHNVDTGWNINVSGKVFSESQHRANKNTSAIPHLQNINDIVEKAVLLDSYSVGQLKSPNSLLMHSMYAVSDIGYGPELLKLYVEEMNDPNSVSTGKRAYQLQNIEKASAVAGGVQGTTPSSLATTTNAIRTVADLYASVKDKDSKFFSNSSSKIVNPDGTPMILYHQTSSDFTIFDPMHPGAGTRDNETPFGIFMKSSDKNIGLNGDKQMALYARIIHPLEVRDRQHLTRELKNISPDFSKISEEYRNLNFEYQRKADDAGEAVRAYMLEWRKEHPDASRREIYNDARYNQLSDAEDLLIDEWEEEAKKLENRSKDVITRDLEANGYDGVIILYDKGSFGRSTDTYIALHPEQVKSATDNIGTFDKSNPDIRYSSRNRMSEETKAAIDAYRAQQDALSKAQKALYNQERKEIVRAYQDKLKNLERSYSQEVADIQKAFFSLVRSYETKADEAGASGQMVEELTEALKQEVKAHDIDRELWEQEFSRLTRAYEKLKGTSADKVRMLEDKVQHQREAAHAKVESARKTEMRHKIQNTVNTLNRYLLNPTKDIHVPDSVNIPFL